MTAALALVETRGQLALTTSLIVAEGCDLPHKQVIRMVRKYQDQFRRLGRLDFETLLVENKREQGGGNGLEYAVLNEDQATFLITLFRNTPVVVEFKVQLVLAFRRALNEIARLYANPPRADLLAAKRAAHNPMMDALIEFREEAGKTTGAVHFMSENRLCNAILSGRFAAVDEKALSNADLELLRLIRERNAALLLAGLDYSARKARLSAFALRVRTKLLTQDRAA
jgi:phage regulator Rha-like protein